MSFHNIKIKQEKKNETDTYFFSCQNHSYFYLFKLLLFNESWDVKGVGGVCLGKENSEQL